MIAKLFYPKELKEIIADLHAKDDLNEEALEHSPMVSFGVFLFVFIVSFLYLYPDFHAISWAGVFCATGAFILILWSIQTTACRMNPPRKYRDWAQFQKGYRYVKGFQ